MRLPNRESGQRRVICGGELSNERVRLENAELPNSSVCAHVNVPPVVKLKTLKFDRSPVDSDQFKTRVEPKTPADDSHVIMEFELIKIPRSFSSIN